MRNKGLTYRDGKILFANTRNGGISSLKLGQFQIRQTENTSSSKERITKTIGTAGKCRERGEGQKEEEEEEEEEERPAPALNSGSAMTIAAQMMVVEVEMEASAFRRCGSDN